MADPKALRSDYLPQIDSLRAIAVLAVLIQHWYGDMIPIGTWGVAVFFVISGFLITQSIYRLQEMGLSTSEAAKRFFLHRSLRLFPAYYLVLLIGMVAHPELRQDWLWFVAYLSNYLVDFRQQGNSLLPTWSLAVEEQFYLLWFFALAFVPFRRLGLLIAIVAVIAPFSRFLVLAEGNKFGTYSLWANCDALAIGAYLYYLQRQGRELPLIAKPAALILAIGCILSPFLFAKLDPLFGPFGGVVLFAVPISAAYVIWRARTGFRGVAGLVLNWSPLIYIGKISYGIYLYHMLTRGITNDLPFFWRFGFLTHLCLTIAIAAISYKYFESPIRYAFRNPSSSKAS